MTESKSRLQNSSQIVFTKRFEDLPIKFIKRGNKTWITSTAIADGLEIHRKNVNSIYQHNKELLDPYTCVIKLMMKGQKRNVRVFDKTGFIGICIRSNSEKAIPFQKWVLNVVDQIEENEEKEYYIDKKSDPLDILIEQSDILKKTAIALKKQQEKIEKIDSELQSFEERYENEKRITPQTKKIIRDFVHNAVKKTGEHYNHFYSKIWQRFDIASTKGISEKLGQEIVDYLQENKKKFIYGENYKRLTEAET